MRQTSQQAIAGQRLSSARGIWVHDWLQDLLIDAGIQAGIGPGGSEYGGVPTASGLLLAPGQRLWIRLSRYY
jgi:hypothetical protein